jgi:hypothetical protein
LTAISLTASPVWRSAEFTEGEFPAHPAEMASRTTMNHCFHRAFILGTILYPAETGKA